MEALTKKIPLDIIDYDITEEALLALAEKYQGLEITDHKSYQVVVKGIAVTRDYRVKVEKHRKVKKTDALEYCRQVDGEAKRITERLWQIEKPLKETKQGEDDRKAAIQAEKERIEQERKAGIQARINSLNNMVTGLGSLNAGQLSQLIDEIASLDINEKGYGEFGRHAEQVRADALEAARTALQDRTRLDQEATERDAREKRLAKIQAEQEVERKRLAEAKEAQEAELAKQKTELREIETRQAAERKTKFDALAAERQKIEEDKAQLEADKQAEKDRKEREERERRIAEEARAQAAKDTETKVERERQEWVAKEKAKAEEAKRAAMLQPDKEKLEAFCEYLEAMEPPTMKDLEAKTLLKGIMVGLSQVIESLREGIGSL